MGREIGVYREPPSNTHVDPIWLDHLLQDLRYAYRRRNRGFSAVVIATLALGIGMTTAVFRIVNAVLLRPLSFPHPHRVAWVTTVNPRANGEHVAAQDVDELRQLVEAGGSEEPADASDPPVAHGTKLQDRERPAAAPQARLSEQHRPPVLQQNRSADHRQHRSKHDHPADRPDDVEETFEHFVTVYFILQSMRRRRVKLILPALTEATDPYWRPIKYSLFPPLGLATLAAFLDPDDEAVADEHVAPLDIDDRPDLVLIQVYITNAFRAYRIADHYRARGSFVALGGLHVTALPDEAARHADAIFLGPAEQTFPRFLGDLRAGRPLAVYRSTADRTLHRVPPIRRDLIERRRYLVPNSIVVTRGCPHHCHFCYKDAFFEGGRSFYTQRVDEALAEIERLPGRHLYFLDDHLLGNRRFASALFDGMRGMNRLFQGAATVDSILSGDLIEQAAEAGLRSLFVGFETLSPANLAQSNKRQNLGRDYKAVTERLHRLGIMINGSFVFGMDGDDEDVFRRTVDCAIERGITTATFHILTPYPGTALFARMQEQRRIVTRHWPLYDTRHVVYRPARLEPEVLKQGYDWAYREFYRWSSITRASLSHGTLKHQAKHFVYAAGWRKFEPLWDLVIRAKQLPQMTPLLESVLARATERHAVDAGPDPLTTSPRSSCSSIGVS